MRQIIIILIAIGVIILGILLNKLLSSFAEVPEQKEANAEYRHVRVREVKNDTLLKPIHVTGSLKATERIEVYSEVSGILLNISKPFKVGQHYDKGEIMLAMDGTESLLNLKSQRSAFINLISQALPDIKIDYETQFHYWQSFVDGLSPEKTLSELPECDAKLKNLLSSKNVFQQYYAIKSLENRQGKFTIEAPFSGTVTSGELNTGSLIRIGQKIGEFAIDGDFEFECAIPASDAFKVHKGSSVELNLPNVHRKLVGSVTRVSNSVDASTQQMSVFAHLNDPMLKQGMYLEGLLLEEKLVGAIIINRNLLIEEDQVFVVIDNELHKKQVSVKHRYEQEAYITGLNDGDMLLDQVVDGAFEGLKVTPDID